MEVWRLHTKDDDLLNYCYENNVAAMGWSFFKSGSPRHCAHRPQ